MISLQELEKSSEVPVLSQPVRLRREIPVDDIALVILEAPGSDDQDIPFPDPDPFFDFALNPAHPGHPIITPDPDMICPHHQIRERKLFICPFFGQPQSDNRRSVFIYRIRVKFIVIIAIISNWHNSVAVLQWCVIPRRYV